MTVQIATLVMLSLPAGPAPARAPATTPLEYLIGMLKDDKTANPTLAALRSTEDRDLVPVYEAMTRSADKERRLFGVVALAGLVGKDAASCLWERLAGDPVMAIRAEALRHLIEAKAISDEQLAAALKVPDENVQCQAARALVDRGQAAVALGPLKQLASSKDAATSGLSSACLLGLGRREQEAPLRKVMRDPATAPGVLSVILRQIARQKVTSAMPLVLHIAGSEDAPTSLRVLAYEAGASISSLGPVMLRDAILNSKRTAFRVRLLKVLSARADAGAHLQMIARGSDSAAVLARFEMARKTGGPTAAGAVTAAFDLEHPVVVAYVLDRAGEDIKANGTKCDYYVPGLAKYIRSVDPRPRQMAREHYLAAGAASRLIDLGTPAAVAALKGLLAGKATAVTRSTAAGLLRARNPAARDLVRPLLASPYEELSTDAALALGHFGDQAAAARLGDILARPKTHAPALVVLSSWYLLKIAGQTRAAAAQLAKVID